LAFISIDSIVRRCTRPAWACLTACALCLPLEGRPWVAADEQSPLEDLSKADILQTGSGDHAITRAGSKSVAAGPDAFGDSAEDETEPGGPTFSFVDISATGTQLTFVDPGNVTTPEFGRGHRSGPAKAGRHRKARRRQPDHASIVSVDFS
jgi:hypothetical protein